MTRIEALESLDDVMHIDRPVGAVLEAAASSRLWAEPGYPLARALISADSEPCQQNVLLSPAATFDRFPIPLVHYAFGALYPPEICERVLAAER